MKKRAMNIIMIIMLVASFIPPVPAKAAVSREIRVGLTSMYSQKNEIRINNTKISLGYLSGRTFSPEANFNSALGFVFKPATEYYIDLGIDVTSYAAVLKRMAELPTLGIRIFGAVTGRGEWHIYAGGFADRQEAEAAVKSLNENGTECALLPGNSYRVKLEWGESKILIDVDEDYEYPQIEGLSAYEGVTGLVDMGSRVYRGRIEIGRYQKTGLTAVNVVELEEYLYSVVSSEMPASWPKEALKAQAVASRSYALVKGGIGGASDAKNGWRMNDTTDYQVYRGYLYEKPETTEAVKATEGETVNYNNKVVAAYYFSSGGGSTESSEAVWGVELPYLTSMPDFFEGRFAISPWKEVFTLEELNGLLGGFTSSLGEVTGISAVKTSQSGRVSLLRVSGTDGSLSLQTSAIRSVLGVKGTKFKIVRYGDEPDKVYVKNAGNEASEKHLNGCSVLSANGTSTLSSDRMQQYVVRSAYDLTVFGASAPDTPDEIWLYGLGSGHGVGMSQTGAAGMAEEGFTYKEILEYYYLGCRVL